MLTVDKIKAIVADSDHWYFGLRCDRVAYNVGDIARNSHQLYFDEQYDENGDFIPYPKTEDDLYDAGELDGTSTIGFYADNDRSIQRAIDRMYNIYCYDCDYIHVLGSDSAEEGNDPDERLLRDAEVLYGESLDGEEIKSVYPNSFAA